MTHSAMRAVFFLYALSLSSLDKKSDSILRSFLSYSIESISFFILSIESRYETALKNCFRSISIVK